MTASLNLPSEHLLYRLFCLQEKDAVERRLEHLARRLAPSPAPRPGWPGLIDKAANAWRERERQAAKKEAEGTLSQWGAPAHVERARLMIERLGPLLSPFSIRSLAGLACVNGNRLLLDFILETLPTDQREGTLLSLAALSARYNQPSLSAELAQRSHSLGERSTLAQALGALAQDPGASPRPRL